MTAPRTMSTNYITKRKSGIDLRFAIQLMAVEGDDIRSTLTHWGITYGGFRVDKGNGKPLVFKSPKSALKKVKWLKKQRRHRQKWNAIWKKAYKNCPARMAVPMIQRNIIHPPNSVELGEFIKKRAKNRMTIQDGHVIESYKEAGTPYIYGRTAAMARLLGYYATNKRTGRRYPHSLHISGMMANSMMPRDPEKQKLLIRLSKPGGDELALKMLTRMGLGNRYQLT